MNHKPRSMKGNQPPGNQRGIFTPKPGKKLEEKSAGGFSDWSLLPVEILEIIVDKLQHFGDRLSLASVCKDWRIPVTPRPLPWTVTLRGEPIFYGTTRSVTISFEFHEICSNVNEPCHLRPYKRSLEIAACADRFIAMPRPEDSALGPLILEILPPDHPLLSDNVFAVLRRIEESKLGWLVVSMTYRRFIGELFCQLAPVSLFVYHPFSARFMSIPDLPHGDFSHHTVTFSGSDPTSPECVFFLIVWNINDLSIHTWSPGQAVWKERHVIVADINYWHELCCVTWLDGIFYWCNCIHAESFNPSNGERNEITLTPEIAGVELLDPYHKLFELNGEIFMLVYDIYPVEMVLLSYKFNPVEGTWIDVDDFMNDRLLFMSKFCPSSYSVSGYGKSSWVFRSYALSSGCQDNLERTSAIERLMIDCLAKTVAVTSGVEWLHPPLKTSV